MQPVIYHLEAAPVPTTSSGLPPLTQEVLSVVQNVISRVDPIQIVHPEIEEQLHFEDTYTEKRLNKNIDVDDIDVETIYRELQHKDQQSRPITKATIRALYVNHIIRLHMDSGANQSITRHKHILHDLKKIPKIYIDGVGGEVEVEHVENLKLKCNDDTYVWVRKYYHPQAPETIVSPTDIVMSSDNPYNIWTKYCNVATGQGTLSFLSDSGLNQATVDITMENGLWYAHQNEQQFTPPSRIKPILRRMTATAEFEL